MNIRDISVKCGNCDSYQTLAGFARREEWNVYTFECDHGRCDPAVTRTLVVSRDPAALSLARLYEATSVSESGQPELNAALRRAIEVAHESASRAYR